MCEVSAAITVAGGSDRNATSDATCIMMTCVMMMMVVADVHAPSISTVREWDLQGRNEADNIKCTDQSLNDAYHL